VSIARAEATLTLSNLLQSYTGTARSVSATTTPPGLPVILTYNGSLSAPTSLGTYTVVGTINDPNYQGRTTNTLTIVPQLAVGNAFYSRASGVSLRIPITTLLTNATSLPAGGTFTLAGLGISAQSAAVYTNDTYILYTPANENNDNFTYTVKHSGGGTAAGTLFVNVVASVGPIFPSSRISIVDNTATISAFGIPGFTYVLQTATNIVGPWWSIATNAASLADGSIPFVDPNATNSQQYYRTAQP
jgi:hypothetical protein